MNGKPIEARAFLPVVCIGAWGEKEENRVSVVVVGGGFFSKLYRISPLKSGHPGQVLVRIHMCFSCSLPGHLSKIW